MAKRSTARIGDTFNCLTIIGDAEDYVWRDHHYKQWLCQCVCGKKLVVRDCHLKNGNSRSCGCMVTEWNKNKKKKVNYEVKGDTVVCTLSNGVQFLIDVDDYGRVKEYGWSYNRPRDYIFCNSLNQIPLSRFLLNCPPGFEVDHINHNRLDNRRCNLRIATKSENSANTRRIKNGILRYKGVSYCTQTGRWRASIHYGDMQTTIGRYDTMEQAAVAHDLVSYKLYGDFAWLNFPNLKNVYETRSLTERMEHWVETALAKKC